MILPITFIKRPLMLEITFDGEWWMGSVADGYEIWCKIKKDSDGQHFVELRRYNENLKGSEPDKRFWAVNSNPQKAITELAEQVQKDGQAKKLISFCSRKG